jgi:HK97 family phage prohead protease
MPDPLTPIRRQPYREGLSRSAGFDLVRTAEGSDGLTIDGYGAVFGSPTRIDSWEGTFDEVIAPGAFKRSINNSTPIMQFDHGRHPLVGSLPLGRWDTVEEDAQGLHVVGRLSDNWLIEPFRDAIRDGGVTGMSFRFSVVRDEWTDAQGRKVKDNELDELLWTGGGERGPLLRTLKEVRVSEVGPVTWPAYDATSVGVDLGRLDLRTEHARSELARAVALAESAVARTPQTPADPAGNPSDAPRSTEDAPDEHSAKDSPVTAPPSPGEHSSATDLRRRAMREKAEQVKAIVKNIK